MTDDIKHYVLELDLDILFLTETWLRSGSVDSAFIRELTPAGYSFKHKPRVAKHRGGGLGILFKSSIGLKVKDNITTMTSFECMECSFTLNNMYRPVARLFCVGGSNWSNLGTFYDYAWIILQSC